MISHVRNLPGTSRFTGPSLRAKTSRSIAADIIMIITWAGLIAFAWVSPAAAQGMAIFFCAFQAATNGIAAWQKWRVLRNRLFYLLAIKHDLGREDEHDRT